MHENKLKSVGFLNPSGASRFGVNRRHDLYEKEKKVIKDQFKDMPRVFDWNDPVIAEKLDGIAKKVIKTAVDTAEQTDMISSLLPTEFIDPGDTFVFRELYGPVIHTGSYGAAVQMSRPQNHEFTAVTNLKEVGIRLELTQVQAGKYSASELGEYTGALITAYRNRVLFTNTLAGMSEYQTGGAQYIGGVLVPLGTMLAALDALEDVNEPMVIVGRRKAVARLSSQTGFSNDTRREWEKQGQIGTWGGIPILKVNSFTDNDYGTVYPMPENELWMFSEQPAGVIVMSSSLRTSSETVPRSESFNMYFRFDDGIGIWKTDRIVRIAAIT